MGVRKRIVKQVCCRHCNEAIQGKTYEVPSLYTGRFHVNCAQYYWYIKYVSLDFPLPLEDIMLYGEMKEDTMRLR